MQQALARNGRYRQPVNDVTLKCPVFSDISGVGKWEIFGPPWLVAVYSHENPGKDRSCHQRGALVVSSRDYMSRNRDQREYDKDVVRNPRAETPFHFAKSLRLELFGRMESAAWPPSDGTTREQPPEVSPISLFKSGSVTTPDERQPAMTARKSPR